MANWAAGKSSSEITMEEIERNFTTGLGDVGRLLEKLVGDFVD